VLRPFSPSSSFLPRRLRSPKAVQLPARGQRDAPVLAGKSRSRKGRAHIRCRRQIASRRERNPVYKGERMLTGADGRVHIDTEDGGYIGVHPDET